MAMTINGTQAASRAGTRVSAREGRRWHGRALGLAYLAPVLIYLVAFYAYPLYRNVELSLRDYTCLLYTSDAADE